jgi:hypothetical protein
MQIQGVGAELAVVLPLVLVGEALVAGLVLTVGGWQPPRFLTFPRSTRGPGRAVRWAEAVALAGAWLALTVISLWCGYAVTFMAVHTLLFALGPVAAWIGLLAGMAALVAIPFAWGVVIRRQARRLWARREA